MALDFPASPSVNDTYTSGGRTWRWNGTAWVGATPYSGQATITGGTINNTPIGGTTRAAGAFTTVDANSNILSSGGIVGYSSGTTVYTIGSGGYNGPVGGSTPAAGAFTTLAASGNVSFVGGTNQRLYVDTTGTAPNRFAFQSGITNTSLALMGLPNGTNGVATIGVCSDSAYTAGQRIRIAVTKDTNCQLVSDTIGGATALPLEVVAQGVMVGSFSSTGLAVTGIGSFTGAGTDAATNLAVNGNLSNPAADTTTGYIRQRFDSNTSYGTYWKNFRGGGGTSYKMVLGVLAGGTETDVATISSTGLAVTGTVAATDWKASAASGNSLNIINRPSTSTLGGIQYQTATSAKWYVGLVNDSTDDYHWFSYATSADVAKLSSTGLSVTGIVSASVADKITLSGVAATDQYFLAQNYTNADGTESVTTAARASWRFRMRNATSVEASIDYRAAAAAASAWSSIATFTSTGLAVTGALSASASISGYAGAELRLLGGAGTENAIATTATGTPSMLFDHRGTSNTGNWKWRYGTAAATLAMQLDSTGLSINANVNKIGDASNANYWQFGQSATALNNWLVGGEPGSGRLAIYNGTYGSTSNLVAAFTSTGLAVTGALSASGAIRITTNNAYFQGSTTGGAAQAVIGVGGDDNTYVQFKSGQSFRASDGSSNLLVLSSTSFASSPIYSNTTGSAANVFVDSAGVLYRSTSSIKYKRDVEDYTRGLDALMSLRPVFYKGKSEADGDKQFAGLIAEEVHEAGLTEFVQYDKDGNPDALAYQNMVALLVKAVQELTARVAQLENK